MDNADVEKLKALGYRPRQRTWDNYVDLLALAVSRLEMGEKPGALYQGSNRIMSQDLALKVGRDYNADRLKFLKTFYVDDLATARHDPLRIARYGWVNEAEELAPHRLWNMHHMVEKIGMGHKDSMALLEEYDRIRVSRIQAEHPVNSYEYRFADNDPEGATTLIQLPTTMTMANFRSLRRYLNILYEFHYRSEYQKTPPEWVEHACTMRVRGVMYDEPMWVVAADNIFRYQVWESEQNLRSYFQGLRRLSKTKRSHEKFVQDLETRFAIGGNDMDVESTKPNGEEWVLEELLRELRDD